MHRVLVAGLGISGLEAALLGITKNLDVVVVDVHVSDLLLQRAQELEALGAEVFLDVDLESFTQRNFDYIVISPGIHPQETFGKALQSLNIPIISELEFTSRFCRKPLIGVTGTNGKTTTVELLTHCFCTLGKKVIAAGNIGYALSRVVREDEDWDYIIVEVSSFQLESIETISFVAGLFLNVSSDHIDRYKDLSEYGRVKMRLLEHSDKKIISTSTHLSHELKKDAIHVSCDGVADFCLIDEKTLKTPEGEFDYRDNPLKGIHNAENLLGCLGVFYSLGFSLEEVYLASLSYLPAKHRLQFFLKHEQIIYINDSKATNPDALKMALESCGHKEFKNIILIAGGRDKKMDFKVVNSSLCSYVRKLFIYGECRDELSRLWSRQVASEVYKDFKETVKAALTAARAGDIVLLSPGCSSLDSFSSYAERGEFFMETVLEWTK